MGYFFDTYAIIELVKENLNYSRFKDEEIITTALNLGEFYLSCLKIKDTESGEKWCNLLHDSTLSIELETVKKAMKFKLENKKKNLSFVDSVSYLIAKENGLKFLTGDKEFEGMENVEFVK